MYLNVSESRFTTVPENLAPRFFSPYDQLTPNASDIDKRPLSLSRGNSVLSLCSVYHPAHYSIPPNPFTTRFVLFPLPRITLLARFLDPLNEASRLDEHRSISAFVWRCCLATS